MTILDIFKRKKTTTHPPSSLPKARVPKKPKEIEKSPKVKIEKKPQKPKKQKLPEKAEVKAEVPTPKAKMGPAIKGGRRTSQSPETAYRILKTPQITEKATALARKNQYTFKTWPEANKAEIKKAIEDLYGVDVISVKIIKVPRKRRRLGRISGWRKGYKKTIVKIKEGQKIEVLPR